MHYIGIRRESNVIDEGAASQPVDINIFAAPEAPSAEATDVTFLGYVKGVLYTADGSGITDCAIVGVAGRKNGRILVCPPTAKSGKHPKYRPQL